MLLDGCENGCDRRDRFKSGLQAGLGHGEIDLVRRWRRRHGHPGSGSKPGTSQDGVTELLETDALLGLHLENAIQDFLKLV